MYREGQEDQLGALGLVVNGIVLWNTLSIGAAPNHLYRVGVAAREEDLARLSPLSWADPLVLLAASCQPVVRLSDATLP